MPYLELIVGIMLIATMISFLSLAPWVPTKGEDLGRINDIIKLQPGEEFLEMGCGTTKVSLFLAKENPTAQITGIELSPILYLISKLRVFFSKTKNIKILYGNALKLDLTKFHVIYVFGLPETITKKIFPRIHTLEIKDFRFISYCFQMTNDYFEETKYKTQNRYAIYEYKIKKTDI